MKLQRTHTPTGAGDSAAHNEDRLVRLPWAFFQDHQDRDLPTPEPVRWNKKSVWVSLDDPSLDDLIEDAEYYGDKNTCPNGDGAEVFHYAAKRLLKAYRDQVIEGDEEESA